MYEAIDDILDERCSSEPVIAELTEKVRNLELALESNRRIGMAIGVLMARQLLTEDAAFDALRAASQSLTMKLREVAEQVLLTGAVPTVRLARTFTSVARR